MTPPSPAVVARDLRKVYAGKAAVDGLNLEVPRGGVFALLGRNLTDKKTFSFATAAALANNPALGISPDARMQVVDVPRTVALQARYRLK